MKLTKSLRASILLAVVTHKGIVIPVTAPFGFHGLPAQFQYYISEMVLGELDGNGVEAFIASRLVIRRTLGRGTLPFLAAPFPFLAGCNSGCGPWLRPAGSRNETPVRVLGFVVKTGACPKKI